MKKNELLQKLRSQVSQEVKDEIDFSFSVVDRIEYLLNKKGFSRKDLAKALNKSESEISKWMTGTHNFTFKTIKKIERALGAEIINVLSSDKTYNELFFKNELISIQTQRKPTVIVHEKVNFFIPLS